MKTDSKTELELPQWLHKAYEERRKAGIPLPSAIDPEKKDNPIFDKDTFPPYQDFDGIFDLKFCPKRGWICTNRKRVALYYLGFIKQAITKALNLITSGRR